MVRPDQDAPVEMHEVVVIGAGVAGLATVINLARRGVTDVVVLEMSEGLGGTWWDNRYPGAEVDVTSELYSFSFARSVFSRTHAGAAELRTYLHQVAYDFGVYNRFRFSTRVESVEWQEDAQSYLITTSRGTFAAQFVVSCVGQLNNPQYPHWATDTPFEGPIFHTSRWDSSVELTGKRVAIIGTGSTSAQAVPEVAKAAQHVTLFQRQPGWVLPKDDRDYSALERARLNRQPWRLLWRRATAFTKVERMRAVARQGTKANRQMQQAAEEYLARAVPDPELRAALTPDYPFYGKRPVLTNYYYPALSRANVTVVPRAVERLTRTGVVDARGETTEVDVVILATGFQPSRFLATFTTMGRDGSRMADVWDTDPESFLGLMASGFPNFFVTYGPNTNGGTLMFTLERQAEWIARTIRHARRRDVVLDVRPSFVATSTRVVRRRNLDFVWASTGNNYYTSASGTVVTQWPFSQKFYWLLLRLLPGWIACRATSRTAADTRASAGRRS